MPGCPRLAGLTNGTLWPSVTVWTRLAWLTTCARFSLDSRRQWQLGVLISYYDGKGSRSYGVSACIILNPLNDPAMYTMPCHQPDVLNYARIYVCTCGPGGPAGPSSPCGPVRPSSPSFPAGPAGPGWPCGRRPAQPAVDN